MAIKKTTVYCKIVFNGLLVHSQVWKVVEIESHTTTDSAGQVLRQNKYKVFPMGGQHVFYVQIPMLLLPNFPEDTYFPDLCVFVELKA